MKNDYIKHRLQGSAELRDLMLQRASETAGVYGTLAAGVWTDGAAQHASMIMNLGILHTEYMDRLAQALHRVEVLSCALHLMEHDHTLTANQAIAEAQSASLGERSS